MVLWKYLEIINNLFINWSKFIWNSESKIFWVELQTIKYLCIRGKVKERVSESYYMVERIKRVVL